MKRKIFSILFALLLFLSSCSMESTIPENTVTFSYFTENRELFYESVKKLEEIEFDALISKTEYYMPAGSEDFDGIYLQNMEDQSFSEFSDSSFEILFDSTDVKLVDLIRREDLVICAFDMCLPTKNFDYGIYYSSSNEPVYFGDTSAKLMESGNGFSYEKKASYGTKFTFYTEKIEDNYFYYEIS